MRIALWADNVLDPHMIGMGYHQLQLLRALVEMEQGQLAAKSVDATLKSLALAKVAMLVGCPF